MRSMIPLMKILPMLALPVLLAACTTPQERAARARVQVEQMMAEYGPACIRLGYAANSDPWRSCVINLSTKNDLQRYGPGPGYYSGWGPDYYWRGAGGWWGPW